MDGIGEGDIDIIKAPIVIDNVSFGVYLNNFVICKGIWTYESWNRRRARAISCFQLIVSFFYSIEGRDFDVRYFLLALGGPFIRKS